jgi:hypothetical protein
MVRTSGGATLYGREAIKQKGIGAILLDYGMEEGQD